MRITAKGDYAVRAAVELAGPGASTRSADELARRQEIPVLFLQKILRELQNAGLITTTRGRGGGHRLALPAEQISIADVLRAVEGPLAEVHGQAPEDVRYAETAAPLQDVWLALRANIRAVLEGVSLADVAEGRLPPHVAELAGAADARLRR